MLNLLGIFEIDRDILLYVQDHIRGPVLDEFFPRITFLGDAGIFWILLTVILFCFKKTRKAALCSAIALAGSVILNNMILKVLINRTRPYELISGLVLIGKKAGDASFPSGHTAASFASCIAILPNVKKRWWAPLILTATLIALSRIYIGIHYPSDVLGGFLSGLFLGLTAALIGNWAYETFLNRKVAVKKEPSETEAAASMVPAFEDGVEILAEEAREAFLRESVLPECGEEVVAVSPETKQSESE